MPKVDINWFAVFLAGVFNAIITYYWYYTDSIGKHFKELSGYRAARTLKSNEDYAMVVLTLLVVPWILVHYVRYAGSVNFISGAETGIGAWLIVIAISYVATKVGDRPWRFWKLDATFALAVLIVSGGILATIR